ncbi:LutC/YkgG family protein [Oleiharenicola sp. Vm1]|uniref:LutC/YkgG family protein n=1 Tax=Oleiharenicola sp. Vm1 TaxID=3398393 RepID=UPI0039F504DB
MSNDREAILGRVRAALAPLPQRAALPDWERDLVRLRQMQGVTDLAATFCARLQGVNGTPLQSEAELAELLKKNGWTRGYCDPALLPALGAALAGAQVETTYDRTRVDDYAFGITRATAAIAETGTIVLIDHDTSSRLAALAPWAHIVVLKRADILPDIPAALAALPADPNVIWVTGPSKTADVEGILIEGVHGPGVQAVLLVD